MGKIRTEHTLNHTYLMIKSGILENDDYRMRMLDENQIPGTLKIEKRIIDSEAGFFADISEMQSIRDRYALKDMTFDEVKKMFEAITHISETVAEYLIEEGNILLNPEYIFIDIRDENFRFLCLPMEDPYKNAVEGVKSLLLFLMQHVDNTDDRLVRMVYETYSYAEAGNMGYGTLYKRLAGESINTAECKEAGETETLEEKTVSTETGHYHGTSYYIPSFKELVAVFLCAVGFTLIGYDLYLKMLP